MRRLKAKQCWSYSPISIIVRSCSISSFPLCSGLRPLTNRFYRWLKFVQILKVSQDRSQKNVHIWKEKKNIASSCKYQHVSDEKNPSIAGDPIFSFLFHVTLNLALQKLFEPLISSNPLGAFLRSILWKPSIFEQVLNICKI